MTLVAFRHPMQRIAPVWPRLFVENPFEAPQETFDTPHAVAAELHRLQASCERLCSALWPQPNSPPQINATQLRSIIKARRARERMLDPELFADPAWDILLEAYLAQKTQVRLSVTSLCHSTAVPPTTALRWVTKLEQRGWLKRKGDPLDRRRFWMELTDAGAAKLSRYFTVVCSTIVTV